MSSQESVLNIHHALCADSSAAYTVEPDFYFPGCYNVQLLPQGPGKAVTFSDEMLSFIFCLLPRDALQVIVVQEL